MIESMPRKKMQNSNESFNTIWFNTHSLGQSFRNRSQMEKLLLI